MNDLVNLEGRCEGRSAGEGRFQVTFYLFTSHVFLLKFLRLPLPNPMPSSLDSFSFYFLDIFGLFPLISSRGQHFDHLTFERVISFPPSIDGHI